VFDARIPSYWYFGRNIYDVGRDGRFLIMSPTEDDRNLPMTVVLNWPTLLRRSDPERASR
jgi:hypothetical protein